MTHAKTLLGIIGVVALLAVGACGGGGGGDDDDDIAGPDAGSSSGSCDLVGTWSIPGGPGVTYAAHADGTSLLTLGDAGTVTGTWSLAGDTVSLTDTGSTGAGAGQQCASNQVGRYDLAFADACQSVTFSLVSDDCAMRAAAVDGITGTR